MQIKIERAFEARQARRVVLLASVALGLVLAAGHAPARAEGGTGGTPGGGAGGVGYDGAAGGNGVDPSGGGGGGASGGGAGGMGAGGAAGGAGGTAAAPAGQAGQAGTDNAGNGGGGGGGGAFNGTGAAGGNGGAGGAVTSSAGSATTSNATATVIGGGGGGGGAGGAGLAFTAPGTVDTNAGVLDGGGAGGTGGNGGSGTASATAGGPGTATATAIAQGGQGGQGGAGGAAILFTGAGSTFTNSGVITGATGGTGGNGGEGAAPATTNGGVGGQMDTGTTNATALSFATAGTGGKGGTGGAGVVFTGSRATFVNTGTVIGGLGGTGGTGFDPNTGEGAGAGAGAGATSSAMSGAIASGPGNAASAASADGGATSHAFGIATGGVNGAGGDGGAGVVFSGSGATFSNLGTVIGGMGQAGTSVVNPMNNNGQNAADGGAGGTGGTGVVFAGAGASFVNTGTVLGGAAGNGSFGADSLYSTGRFGGAGGAGGAGVVFSASGASFTNTGGVSGGAGGAGGAGGIGGFNFMSNIGIGNRGADGGAGGNGGAGGAGVVFANGGTFINSGTVTGGNGGTGGAGGAADPNPNNPGGNPGAAGTPGAGGVGVIANGVTINNSGAISGGFANGGAGPQAYAIVFTGGRNFVGGGGAINGGIDVEGTSSFMPALPGSPVGTPLAVNGPLTFAQTATYAIRITPFASDSTLVTGIATLNGASVSVAPRGALRPFKRYTIVNATGGVVGTFNPLPATNLAFVRTTLAYDANDVFLDARVNYAPAGLTQNETSVGEGLNNALRSGGGNSKVFVALDKLTKPQAAGVLDSLSGEGITAAQNLAYRSSQLFTSSIFDQTTFYGQGTANSVTLGERLPGFLSLAPSANAPIRELADLPAVQPVVAVPVVARTWRAWATGFGGTEHISGNAFPIGSATQNNDIYGGALGVDYQLMPNYLVGVAVGGSNGDFRVAQRATSGTTTGGHVAFYDIANFGAFYGASSTSFSYFGNKTTRFVSGFGNLGGESENGNFNSNEFRTRLEFGRHFSGLPAFGGLPGLNSFGTVTPFVALELAELRSNGFTETSLNGPGLFRLNVSGQSAASVPGSIGFRFQRVADFGNGMVLSPTLQVAYLHEFAPYRSQIGTITSLPGSTFLVDGARPSRNAAQVKAGTELALGPRAALFVNFDGEFSGVNQLYAGKGGFRYMW